MEFGTCPQHLSDEQPRGAAARSEACSGALPVGHILSTRGDREARKLRLRPCEAKREAVDSVLERQAPERTLWQLSIPVPEHTAVFKLLAISKQTLGSTTMREAVKLPAMVKRDEWLAAKTVGLYHEVVQLVSVATDICTAETCPQMRAGKNVLYKWKDAEHPEPVVLPARDYMSKVLGEAFRKLTDRKFIPDDGQAPFPSDFEDEIKQLLKRFFRIYAHMYLHHADVFQEYKSEAHLNYCFKHLYYFATEFDLVGSQEMAPLIPLIDSFAAAEAGDLEQPQ